MERLRFWFSMGRKVAGDIVNEISEIRIHFADAVLLLFFTVISVHFVKRYATTESVCCFFSVGSALLLDFAETFEEVTDRFAEAVLILLAGLCVSFKRLCSRTKNVRRFFAVGRKIERNVQKVLQEIKNCFPGVMFVAFNGLCLGQLCSLLLMKNLWWLFSMRSNVVCDLRDEVQKTHGRTAEELKCSYRCLSMESGVHYGCLGEVQETDTGVPKEVENVQSRFSVGSHVVRDFSNKVQEISNLIPRATGGVQHRVALGNNVVRDLSDEVQETGNNIPEEIKYGQGYLSVESKFHYLPSTVREPDHCVHREIENVQSCSSAESLMVSSKVQGTANPILEAMGNVQSCFSTGSAVVPGHPNEVREASNRVPERMEIENTAQALKSRIKEGLYILEITEEKFARKDDLRVTFLLQRLFIKVKYDLIELRSELIEIMDKNDLNMSFDDFLYGEDVYL